MVHSVCSEGSTGFPPFPSVSAQEMMRQRCDSIEATLTARLGICADASPGPEHTETLARLLAVHSQSSFQAKILYVNYI